ncbi:hypothetical protein EV401DRAFT_1918885 [Pisolithus croceorrhizus]|nr:hypothetical protein EV401DRAFT_1918885 [Pisolithus croceorrhizus]
MEWVYSLWYSFRPFVANCSRPGSNGKCLILILLSVTDILVILLQALKLGFRLGFHGRHASRIIFGLACVFIFINYFCTAKASLRASDGGGFSP